ncbi:MAG: helix-turn-helix transcriptional regulator, partial [Agathobacter sp.]|nr:helix-turn-helix transcriptional regulator [Agathobacter sp.]
MTDKQIGNLVKEIRKEKNIGIEMVTRGLCSSATLSYFEKGQRKLDNLLLYCIFDRIGIEIDKFAFMVDENQYRYHLWKSQTFEAIEKQEWDTLERLLINKENVFEKTYSKKIQYQYYYKMKAILEAEKYHNYKMATFFLKKSIEQTMPTVLMIQWDKICLGEQELHILMLYLYYGTRAEYFDKEEQKELYRKLANYINIEHLEDKKLARVYPKLVCIWMHITQLPLLERKKLCEDAIRILQETRRLHDIVEVLRFYVEILENEKSEKEVYYRKHYENFKDILENAGIECRFRPELLVGRREKLFLITEYLRSARLMKGMTQQEVCFGICEPETYSRIETGKHVPVKSNMYQLAERLGVSWCFYRGEIEIGSLQAYEMYQLVKKYSNRGL